FFFVFFFFLFFFFFFFNDTATTEIYTLSLHDALPIWTQPLASYKGEFVQFKDAEVYPKPFQKPHPPVWVGGWMKLAAKRAGKYGEGWIPGWLSPKEMKVGCDILAQAAREKGRDPSKITIG